MIPDLRYVEPFVQIGKKAFAISYKIFHIGLNLMYLLTSINMLALMEWPNQVNDLYRQIKCYNIKCEKMVIPYFCLSLCKKLLICHFEIKHKEGPL